MSSSWQVPPTGGPASRRPIVRALQYAVIGVAGFAVLAVGAMILIVMLFMLIAGW